jgi:hypothetical protein
MGIDELLKGRRDEILRIAEKHGARNLRVFGSFARGEAGPASDVDLIYERGAHRTQFFPGGLVHDLEALLGRRVQAVSVRAFHPLIRDRVLEEAVPVSMNELGG